MKIDRLFTQRTQQAYEGIEFESRNSRITNPDGSVVFEAANMSVPKGWSQVAVDILAQKYFRRAGVPVRLRAVPEDGVSVLHIAPTVLSELQVPVPEAMDKAPLARR